MTMTHTNKMNQHKADGHHRNLNFFLFDPKIKSSEEKIKRFAHFSAEVSQSLMSKWHVGGGNFLGRGQAPRPGNGHNGCLESPGWPPARTPLGDSGPMFPGCTGGLRHHPGTVESSLSQPAHYSITLYGPGTQRRTHRGSGSGCKSRMCPMPWFGMKQLLSH